MEKAVLSAIERFSLIPKGSQVTVALSGGADSMSLLYCLLSCKERLGITVSAAHYNHGIRHEESDEDERFVKAECERLRVPLFCEKGDVPTLAREKKIGIELAAREARYAFLERVSPDLIATAHTASDNLETMLLNLVRGSGAKGLGGIPPKRGRIIRPLITVTREEVERYCQDNGIRYVTDSTNLSDEYSRNRLRHTVVPLFKQMNPSVERAAIRASFSLTEDEAALSYFAKEYLEANLQEDSLRLDGFSLLPAAVQKRTIRRYFEMTKDLALDSKHTEEVLQICRSGGRISLPKNLYAVVQAGKLVAEPSKPTAGYCVDTAVLQIEKARQDRKIHNLFLKNAVDCDKIVGKPILRTRNEGDSIRLVSSRYTKTLKKLYLEKRVPLSLRSSLPVIADEQGVIWIYGIGVASRCAVSKNTKRVFIIDAKEVQNTID